MRGRVKPRRTRHLIGVGSALFAQITGRVNKANSADPTQIRCHRMRHLIGVGSALFAQITGRLNETVLSPRSGPFSQTTRRDNQPTSAVCALIKRIISFWGFNTLSDEAVVKVVFASLMQKGSTIKGSNLLPIGMARLGIKLITGMI